MTLRRKETRTMKGETHWAMDIAPWGLSVQSCEFVDWGLKYF